MANRIYVGITPTERIVFLSPTTPTDASHGHLYMAVIGPFRTVPGAQFMAQFGANNPHCQTVADAERLAVSADTPPAVCIKDGCGMRFDPTVPETRNLETLKPFAMLYCPKHREPATPPVVFTNIPPADAYHTERFFQAESLHGSETPPADEPSQDEDEEEETRERITCDQCELLAINGVCCHEIGCPNMGARWDAENREWIKQRKCFECGCEVDADDPCCSAPFEDDDEAEEEEEEDDAEDEEEEDTEDADVLRSTVDTSEMHDFVLEEAKNTLDRWNMTAVFEHGQWFVTDADTGAQWSVVDCENRRGEQYFDFEQVTQGDED